MKTKLIARHKSGDWAKEMHLELGPDEPLFPNMKPDTAIVVGLLRLTREGFNWEEYNLVVIVEESGPNL